MAPEIIGAYLTGDLELLRANCREQAFAQLNALVQVRAISRRLHRRRRRHRPHRRHRLHRHRPRSSCRSPSPLARRRLHRRRLGHHLPADEPAHSILAPLGGVPPLLTVVYPCLVQERNSRSLVMDPRILHMSEPEHGQSRVLAGP